MFFRLSNDIHLGKITMQLTENAWEGIRIDNHPSQGGHDRVQNIVIDELSISGVGGHGLETFGVDGLTVGDVTAEFTSSCGVLLNDTVNARINSVNCNECAYVNTGYAAFRVANNNGNIEGAWPAGNVHVGSVVATGGGRGIFSVSGSGGSPLITLSYQANAITAFYYRTLITRS